MLIYLQFASFNDEAPTDVDDPEPTDLLPQATSFQRQVQFANPEIQSPPEQLFTPSQTHTPQGKRRRKNLWRVGEEVGEEVDRGSSAVKGEYVGGHGIMG